MRNGDAEDLNSRAIERAASVGLKVDPLVHVHSRLSNQIPNVKAVSLNPRRHSASDSSERTYVVVSVQSPDSERPLVGPAIVVKNLLVEDERSIVVDLPDAGDVKRSIGASASDESSRAAGRSEKEQLGPK